MLTPDDSTARADWPYGYGMCCCGCGQPSPIIRHNEPTRGLVKGAPFRFIKNHHIRKYRSNEQRLLSRLILRDEESCWEWLGWTDRDGYGEIGQGGRLEGKKKAHRAAYETWIGPIPDGLLVCHTCNNPSCCNPYHLYAGTHEQNMADMDRAGRRPRGEASVHAKITEVDVIEIRRLVDSGVSGREVGARFGLEAEEARRIAKRLRWKHVA